MMTTNSRRRFKEPGEWTSGDGWARLEKKKGSFKWAAKKKHFDPATQRSCSLPCCRALRRWRRHCFRSSCST